MRRFLAVLFFAAMAASAVQAQTQNEDTCDSYPDVPVKVTPRFDEPAYDYSVDMTELQTLSHDVRHAVHGSHVGITLGLTRYYPMIEFAVPVKSIQFSNGLSCAHVDHVDVTVGYKNVTVYVPHEIPQGTCGFDQVITHEKKHLAVNQAVLDEYAPQIESKLKDYLRLNGVFREENPDYALSLLRGKLQEILDGVGKEIFAENARRQQLVDTMEEYRRVSASCNGQLANVAGAYRKNGN